MEKIKIDFGEIIHVIRTESGETQRNFADRVGIKPQTLANIESGLQLPNVLVANKMCKCLGVKIGKVMRLVDMGLEVDSIAVLKDMLTRKEIVLRDD